MCSICTYYQDILSTGGVIYDLNYLKSKVADKLDGGYGSSPILCGFKGDGGTVSRPARGGCGVSTNIPRKKCQSQIINPIGVDKKEKDYGTTYWPGNSNSDACKNVCIKAIEVPRAENCVGNVLSDTDQSLVDSNIPYYIKGSRASYNYDNKNTNSLDSGSYDTVMGAIIDNTASSRNNPFNEILVDAYYLHEDMSGLNSEGDEKAIVAFFVSDNKNGESDEKVSTCSLQKLFNSKYPDKKVHVFSLNTNWNEETDNAGGPFTPFDCSKKPVTECTNPMPYKAWSEGSQNVYRFCVTYSEKTYQCMLNQSPHCVNTGPGPSSINYYWKELSGPKVNKTQPTRYLR